MSDFRTRVEGERPYLLRYAGLQLRDRHTAEDVVQETLLAALAGEASFGGRSNLRTWLTGILKHKIVDAIRRAHSGGPARAEGVLCEAGGVPAAATPRHRAAFLAARAPRLGDAGHL